MPWTQIDNPKDFINSSLSPELRWRTDGSIELTPENLYENHAFTEFSEGQPTGYDLRSGLPEEIVAHHINISRPGKPRRKDMHRQSTAPVEDEPWEMQQPWIAGVPATDGASLAREDDRKPDPPFVNTTPSASRGFPAGTYGYAWGLEGDDGLTTFTAFRYFELANNQRPSIPVPESFAVGTRRWVLAMTRRNGGPSTAAIQRRLPIERLRGREEVVLSGPWRNLGSVPSQNNSGLTTPPRPHRGTDVRVRPSRRKLRAGIYRLFVQLSNERGVSMLSEASRPIVVRGDRERVEFEDANGDQVSFMANGEYKAGVGIECKPPKIARRRDIRYTYWIQFEPFGDPRDSEESLSPQFYRVYPRYSGQPGMYFAGNRTRRGVGLELDSIWVHGYPPDEEPRGLAHGLVQEEPPAEDTSVLEPPDATSVPDEVTPVGTEIPPAGKYLVSVTGVTGSGAYTRTSEPAEIAISEGEVISVNPRWVNRINELANPLFSALDAEEKPRYWRFIGVADTEPGDFEVNAGVLTLRTLQSTASSIYARSLDIGASSGSVFTIGGELEVRERISGVARVSLYQFDSAGATLGATLVTQLGQNGLKPFSVTLEDLHPETASVSLFCLIPGGVEDNANLTARFSKLRVLRSGTDVRRVALNADGSGDMDAPADTPLTGGSFVAYGPAPQVGQRIVEATPPVQVVGFEGGSWDASWTDTGTASTTSSEVSNRAAIHGSYGWRIEDSANQYGQRYRERAFGFLDGKRLAMRFLCRIDRLPTAGLVVLGSIGSTNRWWADVRLTSRGQLILRRWQPQSDTFEERHLTWGAATGDVFDIELSLTGGTTSNGIITVGLAKNGYPRRIFEEIGGINYTGLTARTCRVGVLGATEASARWAFSYDQIVITERGDVLDRETSNPPTDYTPPPPDVPALEDGSGYRELDPDGNRVNQAYILLEPGTTESVPVTLPFGDPVAVKPGASYTVGLYARWFLFNERITRFRVWLEGENVEPVQAAVMPMSTSSEWQEPWATFDVPELADGTYTTARAEITAQSGVYVLQEPLFHEGLLTTKAQRDARRSYNRARGPATIEAVLRADPPGRWALDVGRTWSGFGIEQVTDEALDEDSVLMESVTLERSYATSRDNVTFSEEVTDPALVTPNEPYLKLKATLSGDGRYGPRIAPGGMHLRTWHGLSTLLRADGTHFDGVAVMGNIHYSLSYPDAEAVRVGGHHQTVESTEDIGRLYDLVIMAFSEDAAREIEEDSLREEFVVEAPTMGNSAAGMSFRIRMRDRARFETENLAPRIVEDLGINMTALFGIAEVEEAEVLESAPLEPPLSWSK